MKAEHLDWSHRHFEVGGVLFTVVNDGYIFSGPPGVTHRQTDPAAVDSFLNSRFLPLDRLDLTCNVLFMHRGRNLVMFDAGAGDWSDRPVWAAGAGRLLSNMRAAGLSPASVDAVVLSHCHCDHIGGLLSETGRNNFPNAEIHLSETEYRHWIDAEVTGPNWAFDHKVTLATLESRQDRLNFVADGQNICDGIVARSTPGHTVGHTSYVLEAGSERLCILGDVARHWILNLERPDWEFIGDADSRQTVQTRRDVLSWVARERMPVLSYHFPFGGAGHIAEEGPGFRFLPTFT